MSYGIRRAFYNSKAWKNVKKSIWIKQNLLCNRCGKPIYVEGISKWIPKEKRNRGIVHHRKYLDDINVYDDNVALSENNLEGICKECHELEHHQDQVTRNDYMFNSEGNLVKKVDTPL